MSNPFITPDILRKIMLKMDYNNVLNICMTNKLARNICNDKYFWAVKTRNDYGINIQTFLSKGENPRILYNEYRIARLMKLFLIDIFNVGVSMYKKIRQGYKGISKSTNDKITSIINTYHEFPDYLKTIVRKLKGFTYYEVVPIEGLTKEEIYSSRILVYKNQGYKFNGTKPLLHYIGITFMNNTFDPEDAKIIYYSTLIYLNFFRNKISESELRRSIILFPKRNSIRNNVF